MVEPAPLHYRMTNVKRLATVLVPIALFLSACGSSSADTSSTTVSPTATDSSTTVGPTTTTLPALKNPDSGEKAVACDNRAIGASFGEKVVAEHCTATWAMGDTDRDRWNCPKDGCAQTRLFHLADGKWSITATCQRALPLTRYAMSCYIPNVGAATLQQMPPGDVACAIWPVNATLRYTGETGCPVSEAAIREQFNGRCTSYYDAVTLPIEKCDHGTAVEKAQRALRKAGFATNIDGYFGPSMSKGIYDFQGRNNLPRTGVIDAATWKALTGTDF